MSKNTPDKSLLRHIPKVDAVFEHTLVKSLFESVPEITIKDAVRLEIDKFREMVLDGAFTDAKDLALDNVAAAAADRVLEADRPRLRRIINATGVVIHTNLGRSPLSEEAVRQVGMAAS